MTTGTDRIRHSAAGPRAWAALGLLAGLLLPVIPGPGGHAALAQGAGTHEPMELGAVTHFGQGWPLGLMAGAQQIGATAVRDELTWRLIETERGVYDFSDGRTAFLDGLDAATSVTIVFNYPNDLYDDGATPHTDEGREAFAKFIAATLDRFPGIARIEVGNEFNAQNFVFGPIREAPYEQRAGYYFAILKAVYETVKPRHPDVEILGGAAHSIPVGYFEQLFELGGLDYMDGIVIHPYTSQPEHVADHIAILDAAMGPGRVPVYATEFGGGFDNADEAAPYLVRMATAMAAAGVAAADWYALREQDHFPNMGLLEADGTLRPAGRAFLLIHDLLRSGGNPLDISPDAMTYAYRFGDHALVLWGEPRTIALSPGIRALDATGSATEMLTLDPERPLILLGRDPLVLGRNVVLGPQRLVADSYHQFDWTNEPGGADGFEGPWSYYALSGTGNLEPLYSEGGGTVHSEPWHPYIGHDWRRPLSVGPRAIRPVDFAGGENPGKRYAVVERYTSDRNQTVHIDGQWRVGTCCGTEFVLDVFLDGVKIYEASALDEIHVQLDDLALQPGSTAQFVVSPDPTSGESRTIQRRIKIVGNEP